MKKNTLLFIALATQLFTFAQTHQEKVQETVSKSEIEGHIYFLADDLLQGRKTGTAENKIAASYLANTLRGYGVKPNPQTGTYYQPVPMEEVSPTTPFQLSINGEEQKRKVVLEARRMSLKTKAIFLGYGMEEDYAGQNVREKIVIVKGGNKKANDARSAFSLRSEKRELALKAGAAGIIELIEADDETWSFIDRNFNATKVQLAEKDSKEVKGKNNLAYVWIQDAFGGLAKTYEKEAPQVQIKLGGKSSKAINSQNVVGIVEGTDPLLKNEYVVFTAHYDHVGTGKANAKGDKIYNGARDNAVGVTTVLSMAENLAKYPTKRSAIFLLLTAEEEGLLGSQFFVENPIVPLQQIVYCINSDNGGYNDTSITTVVGLERTTASRMFKDAASAFNLVAKGDPAPEQGLFDRSDNVNFAKKGIPAPTYSLGFTAFDAEILKYYHQPADEAESLDFDYLHQFFSAYVLSGRMITDSESTPFWTKGDKYEAEGKKLYNK